MRTSRIGWWLAAVFMSAVSLDAAEPPSSFKVGQEVRIDLAPAPLPPKELNYGLLRLLKEGKPAALPNSKLDAKAGLFLWKPDASQAGNYEVCFAIVDSGAVSTVTRRFAVVPGEVATDGGKVGQQLRAWFKEGTAAGNVGDFYDNHDGGHSDLNTAAEFPQVERVEYTPELKQRRANLGAQLQFLFENPTFGNSSMSAGPEQGGSLPRTIMLTPGAMEFVQQQYSRNQLHIYPEHRDHDPGRNGRGEGYGDLYPANIPQLLISQGSSGSDQPFMHAVPWTMAAFRPEVKQRLVASGLLMPTIQAIFRAGNKLVATREDYLTGKAHPIVFEGSNVDALRMVAMAHAMTLATIPPMVQLKVVDENVAVEGTDFNDPGKDERLFTTPVAIARVMRGTARVKQLLVSAEGSYALNGGPLEYKWVVLRGEAVIKLRNAEGSVAEIDVPWQPRRPIAPGSAMESSRVDIGVFVKAASGNMYSAPGFISVTTLDNESRTYGRDGKLLERAYGLGDTTIGFARDWFSVRDSNYDITDWLKLAELLLSDEKTLGGEMVRKQLGEELPAVRAAAKEIVAACAADDEAKKPFDIADKARAEAQRALDEAKKKPDDPAGIAAAEAALKQADETRRAAENKTSDAHKKFAEALTHPRPDLKDSFKATVESALNDLKHRIDLADDVAAALPKEDKGLERIAAQKKRLETWGITKLSGEEMSVFAVNRFEAMNLTILRDALLPGLFNRDFRSNFVDFRIESQRTWRDVYHYDGDKLAGWTRYSDSPPQRFTAEGLLIVEEDGKGRATAVRAVRYAVKDALTPHPALVAEPGQTMKYGYDSEQDLVGHVQK
jgi:hypothetical protein